MARDFFSQAYPELDPRNLQIGYGGFVPEKTAAELKAEEIAKASAEKEARLAEEQKVREAKHLMSDATADTIWGSVVNTAGGVLGGVGDIAAWVAGVPKTTREMISPGMAPEGIAYHATEFPAFLGKQLQEILDPLYNPVHVDRLQKKFIENYQDNEGLLKVTREMAATAVNNPGAAAEMFITNLPLMKALAAKGVISAAAFIGLVSDGTQQSLEKFRQSHGREPNASERAIMLGTNTAGAALEKVESLFLLGKVGKPLASTTQKVLSVPTRYVTGGLTETAQEGTQTGLTEIGGYQGKLLTDEKLQEQVKQEVAVAAGMGGASGAVGGAGMRALQPVDRELGRSITASEAFKQTQTYQGLPKARGTPVEAYRAFEKAPTAESFTNAVSALANNPHHNAPVIAKKILDIASQSNIEINEDTTAFLNQVITPTQGVVGTVGKTVKGVAEAVNKNVRAAKDFGTDQMLSDEAINRDVIGSIATLVDKVGKDLPNIKTQQEFAEYRNQIMPYAAKMKAKAIELGYTDETGNITNEDYFKLASSLSQQLIATNTRLNKEAVPDTAKAVEEIKAATTRSATVGSSIKAVLGSMRVGRDSELTDEQLEALENAPVLDQTEKDFVKEFRKIHKSIQDVTNDLVKGGEDGKVGIDQYLADIDAAIVLGDKKATTNALNKFNAWIDRYIANRQNVITAFNKGEFSKDKLPKLTEGEFWNIHKGSKSLITSFESNIDTMQSAKVFAALKVNMAFKQEAEVKTKEEVKLDQTKDFTINDNDPKEIKLAKELLNAINAGGIPLNPAKVNNIARALGLEVSKKENTKDTIERIKEAVLRHDSQSKQEAKPKDKEPVKEAQKTSEATKQESEGKPTQEQQEPVVEAQKKVKKPTKVDFNVIKENLFKRITSLKLRERIKKAFDEAKEVDFNFGKSFFNQTTNVEQSIKSTFSEEVSTSIIGFKRFLDRHYANISNSTAFIHNDPLLQLVSFTEDNKTRMPQGITAAIAVGAYQYLATEASSTVFIPEAALRSAFGYNSSEVPLPREVWQLATKGKSINNVADSIGANIMKILDLNIKDEIDRKRVQHALGFAAIEVLSKKGHLENYSMSLSQYRALRSSDESNDIDNEEIGTTDETGNILVRFIRAVTKPDSLDLSTDNETIKKNFNLNKEVFKNTFDLDITNNKPLLKPVKKIPKYKTNTHQLLNPSERDTLKAANSRPYTINYYGMSLLLDMYEFLGIDFLKAIKTGKSGTGYVDPELVHVDLRDGVIGKNNSLIQEFENAIEYMNQLEEVGDGQYADIFLIHEIWRNGRIGVSSDSGINPQGGKVLRGVIGLKSNRIEVKFDDSKALTNFKIAVAAGFGVEAGKASLDEFLAEFDKWVIKVEQANPQDYKEVFDLLKGQDDFAHAMNSYLNIQTYLAAKKANATSFYADPVIEVDGKSNGPAHIALQTGLFKQIYEYAVGIFRGQDETNYIDVVGNNGAYETIAREWDKFLNMIPGQDLLKSVQGKYLGNFLDEKGNVAKSGRNLAKYPFMKTGYGQSSNAMVADIARVLLANIQIKIADTENTGEVATKKAELEHDISVLVGRRFKFSKTNIKEESIDYLFPEITERMGITYGAALKNVLDQEFKEFLNFRDAINGRMRLISQVFVEAIKAKVNAWEKETGQMATEEQIIEWAYNDPQIKKLLPAFKTRFSTSLEEGFFGAKERKTRSVTNKVQRNFGVNQGITVKDIRTDKVSSYDSISGGILKQLFDQLGVGGFVGLTHSLDAANMQQLLINFDVFGVHDAAYYNINNLDEGVQFINRQFYEINRDYSMAEIVEERLDEIYDLLVKEKYSSFGITDKTVVRDLHRQFKEFKGIAETIPDAIRDQNNALALSKVMRKELFERPLNIHQFPWPGSHYTANLEKFTQVEPLSATTVDADIEAAVKEDIEQELTTLYKGKPYVVEKQTTKGFTIRPKEGGKAINIKNISDEERQRIIEALKCRSK